MAKGKSDSSSPAKTALDAGKKLKDIYKERVSKGTTDSGGKYVRYENRDKSAGAYSSPDFKSLYYNNDNGTSAFLRKAGADNPTYIAGLSNPNWNIPEKSHGLQTPLGYFEVGGAEGDDGETGYVNYESLFRSGTMNTVDGGRIDSMLYRPNDYANIRANKIYDPNGQTTYAIGYNDDRLNIPDVYKEMNTPIGQFTLGTNDGNPNIGATYSPNAQTQALYANFLNALANLRR